MNLGQLFWQGDAVSRTVAVLLLLLSVASWVVIVWKAWLLQRAGADIRRGVAAFWQGASITAVLPSLKAFDRETLVLPLVYAIQMEASGTLASAGILARVAETLHPGHATQLAREAAGDGVPIVVAVTLTAARPVAVAAVVPVAVVRAGVPTVTVKVATAGVKTSNLPPTLVNSASG